METKQIWERKLPSGLQVKEIFNLFLIDRLRFIKDMQFTIKKEDIKHETKVFKKI